MIIYLSSDPTEKDLVKAINDKTTENIRLEKLQSYYKGEQAIQQRYYDDPTKPNNRIVVNYCKQVADFFASYIVGLPVTYKDLPKDIETNFKYNDNDDTTLAVVTQMNINGFGVELFYMDGDGVPRFTSLDPKECIIIMNDDLQEDIKGFLRLVKQPKEVGGYIATYYTDSDYTTYRVDEALSTLTQIEETTAHYFLDVPITLYLNNLERQGTFEQAIPMQDALNKIYSDNVNDFESFVDSYLVLEGLQGTTSEDIANMKRDRVLLTDKDSKAYWLTKNVNNTHIKQLQDDIQQAIKDTCSLPDFDEIGKVVFSQSGEALKVRLMMTDIYARNQERNITKGLQRKVELLYNILRLTAGLDSYTAVSIEFEKTFDRIIYLTSKEAEEDRLNKQLGLDTYTTD